MTVLLPTLTPLVEALKADRYTVIGPAKRDEAIVLTELDSADDLPYGWGVATEAGSYRLRSRDQRPGERSSPSTMEERLKCCRHLLNGMAIG